EYTRPFCRSGPDSARCGGALASGGSGGAGWGGRGGRVPGLAVRAQSQFLDALRDERRVGKRRREICHVAVGGVVEQDDGLVAGEFAEPGEESGGPVVGHPAVSREVDQPPGLLVAEQAAVEPVTERRA